MRSFSSPGQATTQLAGDGCHHTDRQPFIFEHRPLFQVNFQKTGQAARGECRTRQDKFGPAPSLQNFPKSLAIPIRQRQLFRGQQPAERLAPNVSTLKPDTFFVAESGNPERKWQNHAGRSQNFHCLDRQHHTKRSVESAGIAHSVQMGPEKKDQFAGTRWRLAQEIGQAIFARRQPSCAHPPGHQLIRTQCGIR